MEGPTGPTLTKQKRIFGGPLRRFSADLLHQFRAIRKSLKILIIVTAGIPLTGLIFWAIRHPRVIVSRKPVITVTGDLMPNTGTLIVQPNVPGTYLFINHQMYGLGSNVEPLAIALRPNTYIVRATRNGYADYGPVQVSIAGDAVTTLKLHLNPKLALLQIRAASPGTKVKVDGSLWGISSRNRAFARQLSPGKHVIQLFMDGFDAKRIEREIKPGEITLLAGSEVALQPAALNASGLELEDWNRANGSGDPSDLEGLIRRHPQGPYTSAAMERLQQLRWENLDKQDVDSLRIFLLNFPRGPYSSQARQLLQNAMTSNIQAEQRDWEALDKNSKAALQAFLEKHPAGVHSGTVLQLLADFERIARAAEVEREEAVAAHIRQFPASKHDSHAEEAAAALRTSEEVSREVSAALLKVLRQYADAWSLKDLDTIVALQPSLNRRLVKAELSPARAIIMRISPTAPPQIDGTRATVVCRRQVEEIFPDGIRKRSPELIVTFLMAKRNGNWAIEDTR
jgi:hypothetical protein